MPEAVLVDVANAIVAELRGNDFGIKFDCELNYADVFAVLKGEAGKLRVDVVPWRSPAELESRGSWKYTCSVDIVVRKSFHEEDQDVAKAKVDVAEVNRLIKLVQDIEEFFMPCQPTQDGRALATMTDAVWEETEKKLDYSRKDLFVKAQFIGWVRVTYTVSRTP